MINITKEIFRKVYRQVKERAKSLNVDGNVAVDYIKESENYKYMMFEKARKSLQAENWTKEDVGTSRILECVNDAINVGGNNMVYYEERHNFMNLSNDKEIEQLIFDLYKNDLDKEVWEQLFKIRRQQKKVFQYQFLAFLFFLKDPQRYMPISPLLFDKVFIFMGLDFQTADNESWENYKTYNDIHSELLPYMKEKIEDATILHVHSLLFSCGKQIITKSLDLVQQEEYEVREKNTLLEQHYKHERNQFVINEVKEKALISDNNLHCEVCGFSFEEHYGSMGHGYIEAHHKLPFTDNDFYGETKIDDLVLVCSNCHRMLHRGGAPLSVEELKELVRS